MKAEFMRVFAVFGRKGRKSQKRLLDDGRTTARRRYDAGMIGKDYKWEKTGDNIRKWLKMGKAENPGNLHEMDW